MHVLNLHFKLRGPGNSIGGWFVHPQVSNTLSSCTTSPCVLMFLWFTSTYVYCFIFDLCMCVYLPGCWDNPMVFGLEML